MNFKWITIKEHQAALAAKEAQIEGLQAKLAGSDPDAAVELGRIRAMYPSAKETDRTEALVSESLAQLEEMGEQLEAREGQLDAVGNLLGVDYRTADLASAVGSLSPEHRTTPAPLRTSNAPKNNTQFRCELDDEFDAMLEKLNIKKS